MKPIIMACNIQLMLYVYTYLGAVHTINSHYGQCSRQESKILLLLPQPDGAMLFKILVAADLCGVDKILKVGGAQAVFATTYGTDSIPKVDKIVGPGNKFVTMAKQMVYGQVDIDKPAGPSEALVYVEDEKCCFCSSKFCPT